MNQTYRMLFFVLCSSSLFAADEGKENLDHKAPQEIEFPYPIRLFTANNDHIVVAGKRAIDNRSIGGEFMTFEVLTDHDIKSQKQKQIKEHRGYTHSLSLSDTNYLAALRSWGWSNSIQFFKAWDDGNWTEGTKFRAGVVLSEGRYDEPGTLHQFSSDRIVRVYTAHRKMTQSTKVTACSKPLGGTFCMSEVPPLIEEDLMTFNQGTEPACIATTSDGELFLGQSSGLVLFCDERGNATGKSVDTGRGISALAANRNWVVTADDNDVIKRWDRRTNKPEIVTQQAWTKRVGCLEDGTVMIAKNKTMLLWPVVQK